MDRQQQESVGTPEGEGSVDDRGEDLPDSEASRNRDAEDIRFRNRPVRPASPAGNEPGSLPA